MSGSSTLKEFLIKIGFAVDETKYRRFQEVMSKTAKGAVEMSKTLVKVGEATVIGLSGAGLALHTIAKGMEGLYYTSQRTGASAKELGALQYGFEQIGLSADQARGQVEGLAAARRNNPGLNGILQGLGIDPRQTDNAKVYIELLAKLRNMPQYQRGQIGGMFGLDESVINQAELNGPQLASGIQQRMAMYKRDGFDPDAAAKKAVEFDRKWNEAKQTYADMAETVAVKLLPFAERFVKMLESTVHWLTQADKSSGGWIITLLAVGSALTPILGALKAISTLKLLTGLARGGIAAGAVTAGETAAGGLAAGGSVAGAGLLGTVGLPLLIAGIVAAVVAYVATHPEQIRKAVTAGAEWVKDETGKAASAVGGWLKDKVEPSLGAMVKKFEGFRDHVYKDVGGNPTWGFGHLVKPGENMAGKDPNAVLASDLGSALTTLHKYVKTKLSHNEENAFADFIYNLGAKNFAGSTLLKKLNSGDMQGAIDQLQHWNHVHGRTVQALTDRRAAEANLARTPDRPVTINTKSEYNISSTDPKEAGAEVERRQKQLNADIVRNFAVAVQ